MRPHCHRGPERPGRADALLEGGAAGPKLTGEDLAHLFEPLE